MTNISQLSKFFFFYLKKKKRKRKIPSQSFKLIFVLKTRESHMHFSYALKTNVNLYREISSNSAWTKTLPEKQLLELHAAGHD
jgi:hypothetical protein